MNRSIKRSHICSASRDAERLEGWWEGLQNQIRVRQGFGACLCLVVCAPTPVRVPVWIVGCTYPAPPCRQAKHAAIPPCVCVRTPECTEVAGEAQKVRKKKLGKKTSSASSSNRKKKTEDIKWNTDLPSHYLPHLKQSKNNNKEEIVSFMLNGELENEIVSYQRQQGRPC